MADILISPLAPMDTIERAADEQSKLGGADF
jgi:hypothetical protein